MRKLLYPLLGLLLCACASEQEQLTQAMDASHAAGRPVLIYKLGFNTAALREHRLEATVVVGNSGTQTLSNVTLEVTGYDHGIARPSPTGVLGGSWKYYLRSYMPQDGMPPRTALVADFAEPDRGITCLQIVGIEVDFRDGTGQVIAGPAVADYLGAGVYKHCGPPSASLSSDYKTRDPLPPTPVRH